MDPKQGYNANTLNLQTNQTETPASPLLTMPLSDTTISSMSNLNLERQTSFISNQASNGITCIENDKMKELKDLQEVKTRLERLQRHLLTSQFPNVTFPPVTNPIVSTGNPTVNVITSTDMGNFTESLSQVSLHEPVFQSPWNDDLSQTENSNSSLSELNASHLEMQRSSSMPEYLDSVPKMIERSLTDPMEKSETSSILSSLSISEAKRRTSNRESAKRARIRKKEQDEVRVQEFDRLQRENQEL